MDMTIESSVMARNAPVYMVRSSLIDLVQHEKYLKELPRRRPHQPLAFFYHPDTLLAELHFHRLLWTKLIKIETDGALVQEKNE